jgi:hypothetical protein
MREQLKSSNCTSKSSISRGGAKSGTASKREQLKKSNCK